jgi:hypothetical protein
MQKSSNLQFAHVACYGAVMARKKLHLTPSEELSRILQWAELQGSADEPAIAALRAALQITPFNLRSRGPKVAAFSTYRRHWNAPFLFDRRFIILSCLIVVS